MQSPVARALSLAMAAAVLTIIAAVPGRADNPTGCRTECDSIPFSPPRRTVVRLSNGCYARVTWRSRRNCGVGLVVAVTKVEPLTDFCGAIPLAALVNEATDSLINDRDVGFFTMGGRRDTCITIGRVLRAACWGYHVECGDTVATPCDTASCCESTVVLCTDAIGRRRIYRTVSKLRVPCDPSRSCAQVCPAGRDTSDHWIPPDTTGVRPDDDRRIDPREGEKEISAIDAHKAWPWRDPRPLRQPVRETREWRWSTASAVASGALLARATVIGAAARPRPPAHSHTAPERPSPPRPSLSMKQRTFEVGAR